MQMLFWLILFLIIFCYFGYPVFIYLFAIFFKKRIDKSPSEPTASIIISAYNEEDCIEDKIKNLLSLDYPASKLEILIGSDGSTDKTNEIVNSLTSPTLSFHYFTQRRGKMATINDLVAKAQNEILIFTDARQSFEQNALRELVANFNDSSIGCVSGELCFKPLVTAGGTAKGINLYWNYEKFLRSCESQVHSMLGATGAIYAIRRELFTPIPQNLVLDDMFVPLKIIQKGFRAIFDPNAKAYDIAADNPKEEYRRKARTLYGNYQIFCLFGTLFNPFNSPIALQLFSHKFLRVVVPFLLILLLAMNFCLVNLSFIYQVFMISQIVFYLLAILGIGTKHSNYGFLRLVSKLCYIPYVFCLLNFSALVGFIRFVNQEQTVTWEKARE
ncbi:glycosyltransferase [Scytonema sp. UIC 10036]|uniref:glycosyltransferase family 2 protein n=1 Tax=Scytonema sp. UIC 10036 TaxID=2304196 RepID=UPI0012DABC50|nr:glycosyltransferase family 2 protein [Scytonema sp. UIC 10036]MUG98974.1 glycosyltransferase [Scytonema sp. UIC 10036]